MFAYKNSLPSQIQLNVSYAVKSIKALIYTVTYAIKLFRSKGKSNLLLNKRKRNTNVWLAIPYMLLTLKEPNYAEILTIFAKNAMNKSSYAVSIMLVDSAKLSGMETKGLNCITLYQTNGY